MSDKRKALKSLLKTHVDKKWTKTSTKLETTNTLLLKLITLFKKSINKSIPFPVDFFKAHASLKDINEKVDDTNILLEKLKTTMKEFAYDDIITTPPIQYEDSQQAEHHSHTRSSSPSNIYKGKRIASEDKKIKDLVPFMDQTGYTHQPPQAPSYTKHRKLIYQSTEEVAQMLQEQKRLADIKATKEGNVKINLSFHKLLSSEEYWINSRQKGKLS
ncbi:hypothetical protein Tco_0707911 [Tanacetum coccineum]